MSTKATPQSTSDLAANCLAEGKRLASQKRHAEASKKFEQAIELSPGWALAYVHWAYALFDQKNYAQALEKAEKATQSDCNSSEGYRIWGLALSRLKRHEEAIEKYQKGLEKKPDSVRILSDWALTLFSLGLYEQAIEKSQKAIELNPNYSEAYRTWGLALAGMKQYESAVEKYKKAVELNADSALTLTNWGFSLFNLASYETAIEKSQEAIQLDPSNSEAYRVWGLALAGQKRREEANEKYEKAADLNPDHSWLYYAWGINLAELRRYSEAIEKYKRAISVEGDFPYPHHNTGALLFRQGRYDAAKDENERGREAYIRGLKIARNSRDPDYFLYFGNMLAKLGCSKDAESMLMRGLALQPDNAQILIELTSLGLERWKDERDAALYWQSRDRFRRAESKLKDEPKLNSDLILLLRLGGLYLAVGEYSQAEQAFMAALRVDDESYDAHNNLGVVHLRQGDFLGAIRNYEAALRRDPDSLLSRSNLGEACLKAQQLERAEDEYKRVLRIAPMNIESLIGLGECYIAMGDSGEGEHYDEAIINLDKAISASLSAAPSKKLDRRDRAAIYYSRGYARVKKYELLRLGTDLRLLFDALKDFEECTTLDEEHQKARRAIEKLKTKLHRFSSDWVLGTAGPWAIIVLSFVVFSAAQFCFFYFKSINQGYYVLLVFGSLLFMIAGLFLPELMKLKIAGIELEKSPADRATPSASIGIKK